MLEITPIVSEKQYNEYCFLLEVCKTVDPKGQQCKSFKKELKEYEKQNPNLERGISVIVGTVQV